MWNKYKSVQLSSVCTKIVIVLVFVCAAGMPLLYRFGDIRLALLQDAGALPFVVAVFYVCFIFALIALFSLDRMLSNIKKDLVFIDGNVRLLRIISWCCFAAAATLLVGAFAHLAFWVIAAMAAFLGLVLRVVKNVFEAAVALKTENDFTV
jgi:hypothetical protein